RYFLCVGGALLTLLFAADALMPRPPENENIGSSPKLPRILIHSERKGPDAVVIDTNQPAIVPSVTAQADAAAAPQSFARPDTRIRQSFAQLVPPTLKQARDSEPKKQERKTQPKRKVARAHLPHHPILFAQPRHFGFFETGW
ncbi:MAG: hypothetical protein WA645_16935, partial [Pseudolabrys sp.]